MSGFNYTNGAPWLLTNRQTIGQSSVALDYLFPDGSRRRVFIDQAHDSTVMVANIGDAIAAGRTGVVKKR